jgi:hypothetical protein
MKKSESEQPQVQSNEKLSSKNNNSIPQSSEKESSQDEAAERARQQEIALQMKKQHDEDLVKLKEQELEEFRQQVDAI